MRAAASLKFCLGDRDVRLAHHPLMPNTKKAPVCGRRAVILDDRSCRGPPMVPPSHCTPVPLCPSSLYPHSRSFPSIVLKSHCIPIPVPFRPIVTTSYSVPVLLCPRPIVPPSHCIPIPVPFRPIVPLSYPVSVPLCPRPIVPPSH